MEKVGEYLLMDMTFITSETVDVIFLLHLWLTHDEKADWLRFFTITLTQETIQPNLELQSITLSFGLASWETVGCRHPSLWVAVEALIKAIFFSPTCLIFYINDLMNDWMNLTLFFQIYWRVILRYFWVARISTTLYPRSWTCKTAAYNVSPKTYRMVYGQTIRKE